MNIAIYARKSCVTDTGESIQNQINICKSYIFTHLNKSENSHIIIYKDEGFSAKTTDRPEFKKMIADSENKKISQIVCYRLDRISRNVSDFSKLIEKLGKMNISFICVKEQFDTSVPMGRAMMYIASVFAQLERETIAERVRDNMIMLSKYGQWLGGTTPLGLKSHKIYCNNSDSNSKYKFYLKEISNETEIVKKIYIKFLECKSLSKTKEYLDNINIKSRKRNNFSIPTLKKILTNPVYCCADIDARNYFKNLGANVCFDIEKCDPSLGIIAYNKRNYHENNGKINPISNWVISFGCHKGIISGKNWIMVNEILNSKKHENSTNDAMLSKKIICKICNSVMLVKQRKNNYNFDYICSTKIYNSSKKCRCNNLNGKFIDKLVLNKIITKGLTKNRLFIKKLIFLKNKPPIQTADAVCSESKLNINICSVAECTHNYAKINFMDKTIKYIFWNNNNLDVKLKNCN